MTSRPSARSYPQGVTSTADDAAGRQLPPGLWDRLRLDPVRVAGAHRARRRADVRAAGRGAGRPTSARASRSQPAELAKMAKKRHATMARFEGAATGVGGVVTMVPDLVALAWIQSRLVFYIAAAYGYDPHDPMRPAELLVLFDFYPDPLTARRALDGVGSTIVEAYVGSQAAARGGARAAAREVPRRPLGAQARGSPDPGRRDRVQRRRQRAPHARARRPGDPLLRRLITARRRRGSRRRSSARTRRCRGTRITAAISAGGVSVPCCSGGIAARFAGVSIICGSTALQRTPSSACSRATTWANAITAAFDAQ